MNTTSSGKTINMRSLWFFLVISAIGFLARIGLGLARIQQDISDPDQYLPFARSLWLGEGFVYNGVATAYRPPLYPILLAPLVGWFGTGMAFKVALLIVQSAIGSATVCLVMAITRILLARPEKRPDSDSLSIMIAGVLVALDPVLVGQASLPMTETLAAFMVAYGLYWSVRGQFSVAGLVFGLAALCRPSLLACSTLVMLARVASSDRTSLKRNMIDCMKMGVGTLALLSPWAARNLMVFGEPVWTTTHGGYTFALANNPVYYEEVLFGPGNAVWSGPRQQAWMDSIGTPTLGMTEPEADRYLKSKTWVFIRSEPISFLQACLDRQSRFWAVAPSASVYGWKVRMVSAFWTIPFWAIVTIAFFQQRIWEWPNLAIVSSIAGLCAVHFVYWTDIRMRAPIVPALAILAGLGVSHLRDRKNRRRESQSTLSSVFH